jgi:hypothetical protein
MPKFDLLLDEETVKQYEQITADQLMAENPEFFTTREKAEEEVVKLRSLAAQFRQWEANGFPVSDTEAAAPILQKWLDDGFTVKDAKREYIEAHVSQDDVDAWWEDGRVTPHLEKLMNDVGTEHIEIWGNDADNPDIKVFYFSRPAPRRCVGLGGNYGRNILPELRKQ